MEITQSSRLPSLLSPLIFLFGSFIKHSFAICAICIITFLWLEKNGDTLNPVKWKFETLRKSVQMSLPLLLTGVIYILLRHCLIDKVVSPVNPLIKSAPLFPLSTYLGYSAWAPLFSTWGIASLIGKFVPRFFDLNGVRPLIHLGLLLSFLSPIPIGLYIWLSLRKAALFRLSGITAILTSGIHFFLYHQGGVIELRDRYYQFPGFLLLAICASQIFQTGWRCHLPRFILTGGILIGALSLVQGSFASKSWASYNSQMGISTNIPPAVRQEIYALANDSEDCILVTDTPILEAELAVFRPPATRFMAAFPPEYIDSQSFHGRAPLIIIIYPENHEQEGRNYKSHNRKWRINPEPLLNGLIASKI